MTNPLEVNCTEYRVTSASIASVGERSVFSCTLSPVTDEMVEALDDAAGTDRRVRLAFPARPLLLEAIEVVRVARRKIRIAGRVVES
jgi:hypothetical protein